MHGREGVHINRKGQSEIAHPIPINHRAASRFATMSFHPIRDGRGDRRLDGLLQRAEVEIAVELVEDRLELQMPPAIPVFAEQAGQAPAGYTCYGPIAGTDGKFDLYWIANHRDHQARGAGPGADAGRRAADPAFRRSPRLRRNLRALSDEPTRVFY